MLCKLALLELSAQTPDLGALNERSLRLPLTVSEAERLQVLNTHWVQVFTQAMNRHRCVLQKLIIASVKHINVFCFIYLSENSAFASDLGGSSDSVVKAK